MNMGESNNISQMRNLIIYDLQINRLNLTKAENDVKKFKEERETLLNVLKDFEEMGIVK